MRVVFALNLFVLLCHSSLGHFTSNTTVWHVGMQYVQGAHQNKQHECMDEIRICATCSQATESASTAATMKIPYLYETLPIVPWEEDQPDGEAKNKFLSIMKSIWRE